MKNEVLLKKLKDALRVGNHKLLDDEIMDLKDEALADLALSGITKLDVNDTLIFRAVKVYCKANFGIENKDSRKYQKSYDSLKGHLSLSSEYTKVGAEDV